MSWTNIDQSQSKTFIELLDRLTEMKDIARYKAHTYARLQLQPGMRVLDAGCGIGEDVRALAKLVCLRLASASTPTGTKP